MGVFCAPLGFGYSVINPLAQLPGPPPSVSRGVSALRRDIEFGGRGVITGTVKVKGTPNVPTKRRVRLLRDRDFLLVRETWSDPVTGAYAFHEIDERYTYSVIADDYEGNFRAVLADRVVPEVMQ